MGMLLVRAEAMREGAQVLAFLIPEINASLAVAVFGRDSLNNVYLDNLEVFICAVKIDHQHLTMLCIFSLLS